MGGTLAGWLACEILNRGRSRLTRPNYHAGNEAYNAVPGEYVTKQQPAQQSIIMPLRLPSRSEKDDGG